MISNAIKRGDKMIQISDIDNAFIYYGIDSKYKDRCYQCIDNINGNASFLEAFDRINDTLNYSDFTNIRKLWKYKDVNELFCQDIDPFITNIIIILSYKTSQENIKQYHLDDEQIRINKNRIKQCFESDLIHRGYDSVRISQMLWAFYFIRVKIIEVGRLQYELSETNMNNSIIYIHIPGGRKLNFDEVIDSIRLSKIKLKEVYNIDNVIYKCDSWLLSKQVNKIIDKNSNIYKFYKLFDVVEGDNCIEDILNFVYQKKQVNNYSELEEDTSLQRLIKNELLNGTNFNIGNGILKEWFF